MFVAVDFVFEWVHFVVVFFVLLLSYFSFSSLLFV